MNVKRGVEASGMGARPLPRGAAFSSYGALVDAIPLGVFVLGVQGRPVYANPAALSILGQKQLPDCRLEALAEVCQAYRSASDQLYPTEALPIARALMADPRSAATLERELRTTRKFELVGQLAAGKGTGQGLALARNVIVDRHAGSFSFQSAVGVGTTFFIRLGGHADGSGS